MTKKPSAWTAVVWWIAYDAMILAFTVRMMERFTLFFALLLFLLVMPATSTPKEAEPE